MRTTNIILIILFLPLIGVANVCAETIQLKSGIFLQAQVLDMTETEMIIKTNFDKTVTYLIDDVSDVDGKPPRNDELRFRVWKDKIADYYRATQKIIGAVIQEFKQLRQQIKETSNQTQADILIQDFRSRLSMYKTNIEALDFSSDLEIYQTKLLEHLAFLDLSQAHLLDKKFKLANDHLTLANQAYYDAISELRTKFQSNGAPQKILDQLDVMLYRFEKSLKVAEKNNEAK